MSANKRNKNYIYANVREDLTPYDMFTESKGQAKTDNNPRISGFKGIYDRLMGNKDKNKERDRYKKAITSDNRHKNERINANANMNTFTPSQPSNVLDFGAYGKIVPTPQYDSYGNATDYQKQTQQNAYHPNNLYYQQTQGYDNCINPNNNLSANNPQPNSEAGENRSSYASRILFNKADNDPRSFNSDIKNNEANTKPGEETMPNTVETEKPLRAADVKAESRVNINYFNATTTAQDPGMFFSPYFQFSRNSKPDRDDILTYPSYRDYLYTQLYRKKIEKIISESEFEILREQATRERDKGYDPDVESLANRLKGTKGRVRVRKNVGKRKISSAGMFFIAVYVMIMLAVALIIIVVNNKPSQAADAFDGNQTEISALTIDDNEESDPDNVFDKFVDSITNG
ncbi:MAG: hypothetical protein LBF68_02470 [Christensenellaceae bacterium]|jgi:hypothetical protein|nr:hypothetical protein [Christensenellaceae bacterium]